MSPGVMLTCCMAVVLSLMAVTMADEVVEYTQWRDETWGQWKKLHCKVYTPREEMYRRYVFYMNLQKILEHNSKYPVSVSYTQGLNQFSDMTVEEYRTYNRLLPLTHRASVCTGEHKAAHTSSPLPPTVDWRTKGYVTPVKNQGECGSCWAFSTTGSVEGQHFKSTGQLLSLSEQQLVDCSRPEGNLGCEGGLAVNAFQYIMSQPGGLETEKDYPYTVMEGDCTSNASKEQVKISGCVDVASGNEQALQNAVATVGPISVAIDASLESFNVYSGGVYTDPNCSTSNLDHAVLVVGYGTYQGQDYWLVKNSWGTNWGMNGYVMMARNKGNMCGIATCASYPKA